MAAAPGRDVPSHGASGPGHGAFRIEPGTLPTWRDHLVLEYEIPKVEGDLGQPNCYVPLPDEIAARKVARPDAAERVADACIALGTRR